MIRDAAVRAETPASADQVFLDSAGSSLPPLRVVRAMEAHLRREAEVGGYRAAEERASELRGVRSSLGRLLGCRADDVALADSATRAWTSFLTAVAFRPGDRILLTESEYASSALSSLSRAQRDGLIVEVVPSGTDGTPDLDRLSAMMDRRVRLLSIVAVPSSDGAVHPVRQLIEIAHAYGALALLDACQSVGQIQIDVAALGVDGLAGTGRKWLRGPRGTGFLYVRPGLTDQLTPAALDLSGADWSGRLEYTLHPDASRFELAEAGIAAQLGLKVAVDYLLELGPAEVETAVTAKAARLRSGLAALPGVTVRDQGVRQSGIVTFTVTGLTAAEVRDRLRARAIIVSQSRFATTPLDLAARDLSAVVRASPHYFVSDAQIDEALDAVADLAPTA